MSSAVKKIISLFKITFFNKDVWVGLFLVMLCILNVNTFIFEKKFEGDIASRMVLVFGPQLGFGSPYKDLWEIIPPGYIILLQTWAFLFGKSVLAFIILHFITILGCAFLLTLLLKKLFSSYRYYVMIAATAIVFFSPALHSMYISSEVFGAFFSLLALVCLFYIKKTYWRIGLSLAFFVVAGQMKDPFLFGIIAVGPFFLWKFFSETSFKARRLLLMSCVLGLALPITFFLLYLVLMGSLTGYQQILQAKSSFLEGFDIYSYSFNAWRSMMYVMGQFQRHLLLVQIVISIFPILAVIWSMRRVKVVIKNKVVNMSFDFKFVKKFLTDTFFVKLGIPFFILGSYMGMYAQGSFSTHYLIQSVVPLYMFIGLVFNLGVVPIRSFLTKYLNSTFVSILLCCLLIVIVMPKSYYARTYVFNWNHGYLIENGDLFGEFLNIFTMSTESDNKQVAVESLIKQRVSPDECILHIYGWHVSRTYLYTERKPCTRFFLINIVIKDWQRQEYKSNILNSPPKALLYGSAGGDFNIESFEKEILNWSNIIDKCYVIDPEYIQYKTTFPATLYWAKYNKTEMMRCLNEANIVTVNSI